MAANNYSNEFGWKQKLADLQDANDAAFNRELAWNKLHQRLQDKRRNKKFPWYWLAAASVAAILMISFLITKKKEPMLVQHNTPVLNGSKPITDTQKSVRQNMVDQHAVVSITNTGSSDKVSNQSIVMPVANRKLTAFSIQIKDENAEKNEIINIASAPIDTSISIIANVPVKKKLRVVHVNELGDPVSEPFQYKKYDDKASARFRFMNQQVLSLPSVEAQTDHKIFSIKTN